MWRPQCANLVFLSWAELSLGVIKPLTPALTVGGVGGVNKVWWRMCARVWGKGEGLTLARRNICSILWDICSIN